MKVPCSYLLRLGSVTCLFQPLSKQCHDGTGPVVLIMIATHLSAVTVRKFFFFFFFNEGLLLTGPGNYIAYLGSHSEFKGRKKKRESECKRGVHL